MFAYDLANMVGYTTATLVANDLADIGLSVIDGTYIHTNRQDLSEHALERDPTHLLWVDDDMRFPRDAVLRLLKHNLPIVGVNYPTRKFPIQYVAIKYRGDDEHQPERVQTLESSSGVEECQAVGFGLVLIKAEVYRAMPKPWFENYLDPVKKQWVGEDVAFCDKARAAGFTVHVDHDLSKEMKHIGSFEYSCAHAETWKDVEDGTQNVQRVEDGNGRLVEPAGSLVGHS